MARSRIGVYQKFNVMVDVLVKNVKNGVRVIINV